MSWGLFNHNYRVVGPEGAAPEPPEGGAVEVVLDVPATNNYGQHIRSMVRCDPASGKIMCSVGGSLADPLYFSGDNGANWTNVGWGGLTTPAPKDNNTHVTEIDYDRLIDRWYMQIIDLDPSRLAYYYYSDDDGTTWTVFTMGNITVHALGLRVQDNGDLVAGGRNNSTNNGIFVTKVGAAGAVTEVVLESNTTAYGTTKVGSTHMVRTFGGGGGGTASLWTTADFSARSKYSPYSGYFSHFSLSDGSRAFLPEGNAGLTRDAIRIKPDTTFSAASTMEKQTFTYPLNSYIRDIGVGSGWISVGTRAVNVNTLYVHYSANGDAWEETPLVFTTPADRLHSGGSAPGGRMSYAGNNEWLYAYMTNLGRFMLVRFTLDAGGVAPIPAGLGNLHATIESMAPDIFYKLDDTGTPSSVVDIGRKNYPNTVAQTITLEQTGLVSDGGTAALFGNGKIRATVTATTSTWTVDKSRPPIVNGMANDGGQIYEGSLVGGLVATAIGGYNFVTVEVYLQMLGLESTGGADNHVHLFILSHNDTAATRLLLSYGDAFKLELASDHKLVFTAGAETLTSTAAITADTATLAILSIEKYGGKVNLYIQDGHEGFKAFTLTVPAVKSVVLGGQWNGSAYTGDADGVTIDYYAMIPFGNANIGALQDAWGVEAVPGDPPVLPDAPTSPSFGSTRLLVKADAAPLLRNHYSTQQAQWQQVYGITNHATGAPDVHSGLQGGPGIIDLTDGKFGGGCLSIPTRSPLEGYPPEREPVWTGLHDLDIGKRDFSLSMWVKFPADAKIVHLASTQYARNRHQSWYIWGGFTWSINVSRRTMLLALGPKYEGGSFSTPVRSTAEWIFVTGAPALVPGAWNFVTLVRRDGAFWSTLNGYYQGTIYRTRNVLQGYRGGDAIHTEPGLTKMLIGSRITTDRGIFGGETLSVESNAVKIDDVAFVLDEAIYRSRFNPPTTAFEI